MTIYKDAIGGDHQTATFIVAASDSLHPERADYVCDGTDDQVQIQAAIDALPSGGGKVVLMEGEYIKENVTGIALSSNTEVEMATGAEIKLVDNVGDDPIIFTATAASGIHISGGILNGNKAGQTTTSGISAIGIAFYSVINSSITGVNIKDMGTAQALSGYGVYLHNSDHNSISNCVVDGCKRENIVAFSGANGNVISNNMFLNADDRHIVIHSSHDNVVCDNVLDTSAGYAVQLHTGSNRNLITNNSIYNSITSSIRIDASSNNVIKDNMILDGGSYGVDLYGASSYTSVEGNHIINSTSDSIITSSTAINNIINNNMIIDSQNDGISIDSDGNQICNNTLIDGTRHGIYCTSDANIISSNKCENNTGSGIMINTGVGNLISSNVLTENGGYGSGYDNGITLMTAGTQSNFITGNCGSSVATQWNGIRIHTGVLNNTIIGNNLTGLGVSDDIRDDTTAQTIRNNLGYVTENSGTATLANGTTSIAVTHGLAVTPAAGDIVLTPIEAWGNMTQFYIDTYSATQFTIHADINPGQDVDFAWKAIVL